ncbi:insulin-like growth factor-binding protein complex acid labile subunit isoform X2 [Gordionus sp. m RMFG-2023]
MIGNILYTNSEPTFLTTRFKQSIKSRHSRINLWSIILVFLIHILPSFAALVSGHHEPKCPAGTSPQTSAQSGTLKYCTCLASHDSGMEVTCVNKKGEMLSEALNIYKNNPDLPITSLILQLNFIPTVENGTFSGLKSVKDIQFRLNRIKNFSSNAFLGIEDSLEKLTILEFFWVSFKYKTLDQIPVDALKPLKNLKELFVSSANIRVIPHNAFNTLLNLEVLKIMSFTLNKIYNDSLSGLKNLKDFSLVTNFLKEIPPLVFSETPNMEKLFISLKSFKKITKEHFSNLRYLRELSFNNSGIDTIESGAFMQMSNSLKSLSLKGNQISTLPESISNLPKLTHLDLSSNTIFDINANSFYGLNSLEHLILSYNIVKNIKSNVLADSKWLKFIDLKANLLTQIPEFFFQTFRNLNTLDLSKNFINEIAELTFYQNDKLEKLDLSNNNLKIIHSTSFKSLGKSLTYLDLSHNYLPTLPSLTLSEFENLVYLNMSHNNMTSLDIDSLQGSEDTLRFIGISDNPWHCDCKMRRFREWYKFWSDQLSHSDKYLQELNIENAKCHTPTNLAGVPILYPPLNAFTFCENVTDFNNTRDESKVRYHIKGTNDIYDGDADNDNFDTNSIPNSLAQTNNAYGNDRQNLVLNSLKQARIALTLSICTVAILLALFISKFLFSGNNNKNIMEEESNNKSSKLGSFLSAIPVAFRNGHVTNVPEDKQTIANHGYPMGTVS